MGKYKPLKQSVYFKRFQVKYRRRREGKTDYRARLKLTVQAKNKYNTPKYRFCVRFTKRDVICQIFYATIAGDVCMAAAYAHELPRYGMPSGLNNWAAAYATGLLLARRMLKKLGLDEKYEGNTETEELGKDYNVEELGDDEPRPFTCLLDSGLKRTSTGSKIFGALKGALDGGLNIPHGTKRFVGYDNDSKELDDETLAKYIVGGHVAEYAEMLQEEDPDKYKEHFKGYLDNDIDCTDMEEVFNEVHAAIRENPDMEKKERQEPDGKAWKPKKITLEERKANLKEKLSALMEAAGGDDDDSDED